MTQSSFCSTSICGWSRSIKTAPSLNMFHGQPLMLIAVAFMLEVRQPLRRQPNQEQRGAQKQGANEGATGAQTPPKPERSFTCLLEQRGAASPLARPWRPQAARRPPRSASRQRPPLGLNRGPKTNFRQVQPFACLFYSIPLYCRALCIKIRPLAPSLASTLHFRAHELWRKTLELLLLLPSFCRRRCLELLFRASRASEEARPLPVAQRLFTLSPTAAINNPFGRKASQLGLRGPATP